MPVNKVKNIVAEQRRSQVLHLKLAGATLRDIAGQVGVSLRQAEKDLKRRLWEIRSLDRDAAETIWKLQSARYERLLMRWWPVAVGNTEGAIDATGTVLAILSRLDTIGGILPQKPTYNLVDNRSVTVNTTQEQVRHAIDLVRAALAGSDGVSSGDGHQQALDTALPDAEAD